MTQSMIAADRFVEGASVQIATRDHGGQGSPLLLIPGAGRTLADFAGMAPHLTPHHRVVAMDLRGHGHSGEGPWDWEAVVDDVRAVAAAYGFERPAIAGHSLGGMIAAMLGELGECRAAVNIDGHGQGRPEQYVGFEPAEVVARLAEMKSFTDSSLEAALAPLSAEAAEEARSAARDQAAALGIPAEAAVEALDRSLEARPDGSYVRRPSRDTIEALLAAVNSLDLFALYRRVRCPLLVYNAVAIDDLSAAGAPPWMAALMAGYRAGLRRDLAQLAATDEHVTVQEIDANHGLILSRAEDVAGQIVEFLAGPGLRAEPQTNRG